MKIKILGTQGEIDISAPYHSKKSGVLIDDKILLDIGDERFLDYKPQQILITHLHPDHAFFVRHHQEPDFDIPIYAPEEYDKATMHIINKPFTLDKSYKITPIPTIHSLKVKSNAYLIEHKRKRILYTGDMIWIEKKYHHLLKKPLDLVITEASFWKKGGMIRRKKEIGQIFGHTGVPNLVNIFKQFTQRMLFVHFGSWFYRDIQESRNKFKELARENNIEIIVGYDGLEVNV